MRTAFLILAVLCFLVLLSGATCTGMAEYAASDIDGWDLSACVNGFDTCWELYWDNYERSGGGAGAIITNLNPFTSTGQ